MPVKKSTNMAPLVRILVKATGMTRYGVYKALREGRGPKNPIMATAWTKALAAAKAKVGGGC